MKRVFIVLTSLILVVCLVSIPVLGASSAEFVDPFQYSEIDYWTDNQGVSYQTKFPSDWFSTLIMAPNGRAIDWISGNPFTWKDPGWGYDFMNWFMHPLGDSMNYWASIGEKSIEGKVISLSGVPRDTLFQGSFVFELRANEGFDDLNTYTLGEVGFLFVDSDCNVVFRHSRNLEINWLTVTRYRLEGSMHYAFNFQDLSLPADAVGVIPIYYLANTPWYPSTQFKAEYHFSLGFSMSALELEAQKSEEMQNTLDNIQDSIDDIANAEIEGIDPGYKSDFDDLHQQEEDLLNNAQNYLNDGMGFFENASSAVLGLANGFNAIKVLSAPVFNLPFANPIILISISLGLIGTLLGIFLEPGRELKVKKYEGKYLKKKERRK